MQIVVSDGFATQDADGIGNELWVVFSQHLGTCNTYWVYDTDTSMLESRDSDTDDLNWAVPYSLADLDREYVEFSDMR